MPRVQLCRRLEGARYELYDYDGRLRYSFHCEKSDLNDTIELLQTKTWVSQDHIDQFSDLLRQCLRVES